MTDTAPPPVSDENKGGSGGSDDTKKTSSESVSREELLEVIRARDAAKDKAKKLKDDYEAQLAEREAQLQTLRKKEQEFNDQKRRLEEDEAAKAGDIAKLRESAKAREQELLALVESTKATFLTQLEEAKAEADTLKNTYLLDNELLRVFSEVTVDPDAALVLYRKHFELAKDDHGRFRPVVRDSTLDVKTFIQRELEGSNRTYLLKTQRANGSGAQSEKAIGVTSEPSAKSIPADFNTWSKDKRKEWMIKNPELGKLALGLATGKM